MNKKTKISLGDYFDPMPEYNFNSSFLKIALYWELVHNKLKY